MTDDAGFDLSRLPQAVQEAVLHLLQVLVQEWPQPAAPPAFVVPPDPRGQLRRTILHVLRQHSEGMSPRQGQDALEMEKDLNIIMRSMNKDGVAKRIGYNRYVAIDKE